MNLNFFLSMQTVHPGLSLYDLTLMYRTNFSRYYKLNFNTILAFLLNNTTGHKIASAEFAFVLMLNKIDADQAILRGFTWDETPEGYEFWFSLYTEANKKIGKTERLDTNKKHISIIKLKI